MLCLRYSVIASDISPILLYRHVPRRMPKNATNSKGKNVAATSTQADEDFDDMLAEVCAADPIAPTATSGIKSSISSSSSSSVASSGTNASTSTEPESGVPSNAAESSAPRN
jgi:hypothetical protein